MTAELVEPGNVPPWTRGDRLRKALESAGVSVQEMADELEATRTTVSNYMHDRTNPTRSTMVVWALRTGVPLHWLQKGHALGDEPRACPECAARDSNPEPAG